MTEDNDNSYGLKDELEDCVKKEEIKEDEQISKSELLKILLECFKDVKGEYYLSAILRSVPKKYEGKESVLLHGIEQLRNEKYIVMRPEGAQKEAENTPSISLEQLIETEGCDKILIAFREQENGILLRNYVEAQISIFEMQTQFKNMEQRILKVEEFWKTYNERNLELEGFYNKTHQIFENFEQEKNSWTKAQEEINKQQEDDRESFKKDILKETGEEAEKRTDKKFETKMEEELSRNGKIGSSLHDAQMNIIQFMAIFVAVFSLVSVNVAHAEKWDYVELFRVNVIMTTAMFTLVILIHLFTTANRKWIKGMVLIVCILWIVLACSAGFSLYLCYG